MRERRRERCGTTWLRRAGLALVASLALGAFAARASDVSRPRVVLLANNSGTETTDLLIPFAVLQDSGVAEVSIVAMEPGPVLLMPGLRILPEKTLADLTEPPDVVIVPAMHDPESPPLLEAVRRFAAGGSLVVSICDGAWVLANAGVLDGRRATSHWYSISRLRKSHPQTTWVQDVRWVRDGNVITSAGVSASEPVAHHLVGLLDHDSHAAAAKGGATGVKQAQGDGPPHDGARFTVAATDVATGAMNYLLPWRWDVVALELYDGVDEIELGVNADLLSRTYAVRTVTFAATDPVRGRRGLRIVPDVVATTPPQADRIVALRTSSGVAGSVGAERDLQERTFDALLADIEQRYGAATRSLVALQIEYSPGR